MAILENIDIDKGILQNIDIDKISYRLGFGISNTPSHLPQAEEMRPNIGWEGEEGRRGREQLERSGSCFPPTGDKLQLTTVVCLIFTSNKGGTLLENLHIVHFYQTHPPKRNFFLSHEKYLHLGCKMVLWGNGQVSKGFIKCHEGL